MLQLRLCSHFRTHLWSLPVPPAVPPPSAPPWLKDTAWPVFTGHMHWAAPGERGVGGGKKTTFQLMGGGEAGGEEGLTHPPRVLRLGPGWVERLQKGATWGKRKGVRFCSCLVGYFPVKLPEQQGRMQALSVTQLTWPWHPRCVSVPAPPLLLALISVSPHPFWHTHSLVFWGHLLCWPQLGTANI